MAKEGRLHKLHRRNWPGFLKRVVPDHTWQQVNRCVNRTSDPRLRWSTKQLLLCWIFIGWSQRGQLTQRFNEGFELISRMFYRRRRCGRTYQGLTQATGRTGPAVFTEFWRSLRQTIHLAGCLSLLALPMWIASVILVVDFVVGPDAKWS